MIKPTIGRVVLFWEGRHDQTQPHAGLIAYVHSDHCINVGYFDQDGIARFATSVLLHQHDIPRPSGRCAEWMPYQKGQAAKTEALESQLEFQKGVQ